MATLIGGAWTFGPVSQISPTSSSPRERLTGLTIAELIGNSRQAGARNITVDISNGPGPDSQMEIMVIDDGVGIDAEFLAEVLAFGGTSGFNGRSSLSRYGMGLPNGPLSRGRRVEVYIWRPGDVPWISLDIDKIVAADVEAFPDVEHIEQSRFVPFRPYGTVACLTRFDRVEYKRSSTLAWRLKNDLAGPIDTSLTGASACISMGSTSSLIIHHVSSLV